MAKVCHSSNDIKNIFLTISMVLDLGYCLVVRAIKDSYEFDNGLSPAAIKVYLAFEDEGAMNIQSFLMLHGPFFIVCLFLLGAIRKF